jgi:L,D-peptidoglycan transpeptidase YkuD (ErfK/YbiS/YcfS/YnhG family)
MALSPSFLSTPDPASALVSSRQLLLVIAPDLASRAAQLQRFTRPDTGGEWQPVGPVMAVSLGKSGLAWGRGLHAQPGGAEKREGDGCAPAGIYAITALFGYAAPDSAFARSAKLPYRQATPDLKAIDDPASVHYNRIVDQSAVAQADWTSCEDMLRSDQRYAVGAVVAHNSEPVVPGAGSCIFLHVWESADTPTAGCTAMALADMTEIAGWLDGAAVPVLVQLPLAEYEALREAWGLPVFSG